MNGQLSENPLAELIRELSIKNLSGRLQLQSEKMRIAVYFHSGELLYAACNLRSFRLGEYLVTSNLLTKDELLYLGRQTKDLDLARTLISEKRLSTGQLEQLQTKQVSDVLRFALAWTDGTWEFDYRAQLNEEVDFRIDLPNLLLESSRNLPLKFISSRFRNPHEIFSPVLDPPRIRNLLPSEVFLLSRVDAPISLSDLVAVSGQREPDAQHVIYSLALAGLIKREHFKSAFRDLPAEAVKEPKKVSSTLPQEPVTAEVPNPPDALESFLDRLASAESHYEVLDVDANITMSDLKKAYYDIARKYHPDRFRTEPGSLLARVESAFARITQAYDTLRDPGHRATYDSKLEAQARAKKLAQSAPKGEVTVDSKVAASAAENVDFSQMSPAQLAERQFKDGFAALELGQRNVALGLLGAAARTMPQESRYRAYYGRALALHESTRRQAETELHAAVKLEPNNAEYRIILAELYRDLGFLVRAKGEAERAVAADQNNRKARDLLRSLM